MCTREGRNSSINLNGDVPSGPPVCTDTQDSGRVAEVVIESNSRRQKVSLRQPSGNVGPATSNPR